jgi:hypothetical protein
VGRNSFELNTPPFLGLHLVFNVDLLRPYFPPLLDTYEIAEQLTPTEINPDYMETSIHRSDSGHTGQGHSPTVDPTLSGCQGRATPTLRKVDHPGPNPA